MRKICGRVLSVILAFILLLTLLLAPSGKVKAADEVKYSDLFYIYASSYLKSTLLTTHSKEIGGFTASVYNDYCNSSKFMWTAVKDGVMAATDLKEFRKLMLDTYGSTDYNYEASLDKANVLLATQLLDCYDDIGLAQRFVEGLSSFAEICEMYEDEIVREGLQGIGIVIGLYERVQEAQLWDKYGKISIGRIEIEVSEDVDLSKMLSNASDAYDLAKAIVISIMMESIRLELIDDIIANAPADSAIYEGMTRLRTQLENGGYSYFYETYLKPEVIDKITDAIAELPLKTGISFFSCYNIINSLVRIAATVIFDVIFDVPGRDDMTTQFILDQYSSDLYLMLVNSLIPRFDGQFTHDDIVSFENIFATYIAASDAALVASEPLLLDSNTVEYNRIVTGWDGIGYEDFINSSYNALESVADDQRERKFFDNWSIKAQEVFTAPSDEIKENCIYVENTTFPGNIEVAADYTLGSDVRISGNVHISDEAVLKIPADKTLIVDGDFTINGYLIDTNNYYKAFIAQLDNDGTVRVEGDFNIGGYGIYQASSSGKLYLAGDYSADSTGCQYTQDSQLILNGSSVQKLTNLSFGDMTVTNAAGITYCTNAYVYGNYSLNGNPLEVGDFSTYMYDGTTFDHSDFIRVTVGQTMQLRSDLKADVVFGKDGEIVLSVAEGTDFTIDGNVVVEGYLIDTSSYYKSFPATLSVEGTLRITGDLLAVSYGQLKEFSDMMLYVGGDYNVSGYSGVDGTVIFNGSRQQTVNGLSAHNVLVSNSFGIKYLSDAHVYGYYALNGNLLDRNGFTTYIYETTQFDGSDFDHVTIAGSMTLNSSVKADVVLSKNGSITVTIPESSDITIDGDLTIEGYLINTSSYYRGYPAYLYLNGTLRVTGNFAVADYGNFYPGPSSVLYVGGDYYVSSYGSTGGTVIFDGEQKQTSSALYCDKLLLENTSVQGVAISSLVCTRLFDHKSNVFTFESTPTCADYDRDGILDHLDPEPTLKDGCVVSGGVVLYENGVAKTSYSTFAQALISYDPAVHYLQLTADLVAVAELSQDVYIDLAGFDLSGILYTDGNGIVLMDSATDGYSCVNMGYFTCVDAQDSLIEPQMHWKTDEVRFGAVKRYLTILDETGFSAHRFYLGITHVSMKPNTNGMGYKAVFYGDEMVLSMVDTYGFTLTLGTFTPKSFAQRGSFISGDTVTLRIENYDVDSYGETQLQAQVFLTIGEEVISSNECSFSLRQAVEAVNGNLSVYSTPQLSMLAAMIERYAVMKTWEVENILEAV